MTTGEPLTPAHRFGTGSVTKSFVAPLVTGIDVPFHGAGGGIVSTTGEVATLL